MNELIKKNKKAILIICVGLITIFLFVLYFDGIREAGRSALNIERSINENPSPRVLEKTTTSDGRFVVPTGEQIPLVSNRKVTIANGKTLKGAYSVALPEALIWSSDAKLVYIRSLGTVSVDGISSGWEIVFGSKIKKEGYVVSVIGGLVASKASTASKSFGYDLPKNWYDSGEAIRSISSLPQFKDATISGLNFYYNEDGKKWGYAVSSSLGTVSVPVR